MVQIVSRRRIQRPQFSRNSAYAALGIISTALSLFVVYRFAAGSIGVGSLGTWSVSSSMMSLVSVADLGLPLTMVREVARARALGGGASMGKLIALSALFALLATVSLAACGAYGVRWMVNAYVLQGAHPVSVKFIFICALVASLTSVSTLLTGALEGFERYDLKSACLVASSVLLIWVAHLMLETDGLVGLAWAFLVQSSSATVFSAIAVCVAVRQERQGTSHEDRDRATFPGAISQLKQMIRVGIPLRAASLSVFFFEPATRFFIGMIGGARSIGIYELASRLCIQAFTLVTGALQVMVPRMAALRSEKEDGLDHFLVFASHLTFVAALFGFFAIVLSAIPVSFLVLGAANTDFIMLVALLAMGWMLHVLASPAYFANMADGEVSWNWISQWLAALVSLAIGPALGFAFGWRAVVLGPLAGLTGAMLVAIWGRRRRTKRTAFYLPRFSDVSTILIVGMMLMALQGIGTFLSQRRLHPEILNSIVLVLYCMIALPHAISVVRRASHNA